MGRGGILLLGVAAFAWSWLAIQHMFPNARITLPASVALTQGALAIKLFLECKCGDEKGTGNQQT